MKRFKNILVYAGTEQNAASINCAVELAMKNEAGLTLMDVLKPLPRALGMMKDFAKPEELESLVAKDCRRKLLDIASEYSDTGVPLDVVVAIGDPACEIVRQVLADKHDLVVKSADGLSTAGRSFGSIARSLLRICPCPVWLLKPQIHGRFDRVLAAIDVEAQDERHAELNRNILELAYSIARRDEADLHVVNAWQMWMEDSVRKHAGGDEVDQAIASHQAKLRRLLDELLQTPYANTDVIHLHFHRGPAAAVIRSVADEIQADLMVMGTVCRSGAAEFLIGNTAETVLADITCSLLALKPDGFVSPVEMSREVLTV